jgi:hypothetical protein
MQFVSLVQPIRVIRVSKDAEVTLQLISSSLMPKKEASTIEAQGKVYYRPGAGGLPGVYAQGRYGSASAGDLWLKNDSGVVTHLKASPQA